MPEANQYNEPLGRQSSAPEPKIHVPGHTKRRRPAGLPLLITASISAIIDGMGSAVDRCVRVMGAASFARQSHNV